MIQLTKSAKEPLVKRLLRNFSGDGQTQLRAVAVKLDPYLEALL